MERSCDSKHSTRAHREFPESALYFLDSMDRILNVEYVPTLQDLLRCPTEETGIAELNLEIDSLAFKLIDISQMVTDRRKWLHFFEDVAFVLFVVSLAEYDQVDENEFNRMHEALKLFEELKVEKWFKRTSFALLFTKTDLFDEKIKKTSLSVCFPEYNKTLDGDEKEYIKKKFEGEARKKARVYTDFIGSLDHLKVNHFLLETAKDVIIRRALDKEFEKQDAKKEVPSNPS